MFYWKKDLFSSRANNKYFLSPNKHFCQIKHKNECFRKINSRKQLWTQKQKAKWKERPPGQNTFIEFEFFVRANYLQL